MEQQLVDVFAVPITKGLFVPIAVVLAVDAQLVGNRRPRLLGAPQRGSHDRYRAWVRHHRLSAADSLYRVLESPAASVLTWLVIALGS